MNENFDYRTLEQIDYRNLENNELIMEFKLSI
jgi:hypothetical protein